MRISYNWLREYVDVKNSAKQAAQWLTMAGLEVKAVEERGKDSILDIEVTTNRPDWLSFIGVARELSAITGKRLKTPKVPVLLPVAIRDKQVKIELADKFLCPRYTGRIIDDVRVGASPGWLKERLDSIGVRSVNNIVDITNFCLFELGQPMHAFDYEKLAGRSIVVRTAKKGEEIITIDGIKRELSPGMLIIADEKRPIAIAGIMGGRDTEVTEDTRVILLESAYFDPISVRKTQRKLGLSSDSSYRFERGVDYEGVLFASHRAARLIVEVCGAKMGVLKDAGVKAAKKNLIKLSVNKANAILNFNLPPIAVKKILTNLGIKVMGAQEELRVEAPSFRADLKTEEDLIEEIARIYGYDKIPTTIPKLVGHPERKSLPRKIEEASRDFMIAQGFDEIITYSLIDRKDLRNIRFRPEEDIVPVANPLSSQQEVLRPTLMPGVLHAARFNINRKTEDLRIFELSKVYYKEGAGDKGYREELNLCFLVSGKTNMGRRQKMDVDFFEIKGVVENLFEELGIEEYVFVNTQAGAFSPGRAAKILIGDSDVGMIGELIREVPDNFDIKKEIFMCEIKFDRLVKFVSMDKKVFLPPKFLPAKRDVSIVVGKNVYIRDLVKTMTDEGGDIVKEVEISDEYFGSQIPDGKKGLTFSIEYLSGDRQLTEQEIEKTHSRIREALVNKFAAAIR